jgi:hypothetical protein
MRILTTILLSVLPVAAVAQLADDEFCENLTTFEHLSPQEYESFEQWGEEFVDQIFAAHTELDQVSDVMPDGWLKNQFATHIADCYLTGRGTEKDLQKAMSILEAPASAGHSSAIHLLASLQVFHSDDLALQRVGFLTLQQEADDGSAYSAGKLGWAYALGRGTEKNEQRALELYFIAAKAGMTYWQSLLAHAYEQGYYGLPIDAGQAKYWREFEPKIHIAKYECQIADNYVRETFPANEELHKRYLDACTNSE